MTFLDLFATPSGQMTPLHATPSKVISPLKPKTARHQVALELLQTERNYVDILNTILKVYSLNFHALRYIFSELKHVFTVSCICDTAIYVCIDECGKVDSINNRGFRATHLRKKECLLQNRYKRQRV